MKKTCISLTLFFLTSLLCAQTAEIPLKINFQGVFSSGSITIDFYFTGNPDSSDRLPPGNSWTERLSTTTLDGMVSHFLGSIHPIPKSLFTSSSTKRYLEVVVDGKSSFIDLVSVPFVFRASYANELAGGSTVHGSLNVSGTLTASGNVGIGTTNPAHKLDVAGIINVQDIYKNGSPYVGSSQWDNVTSGIIYPSGSVGIGTANMNAKLHIAAPQDQIMIEDSNGAPNEKKWLLKAANGSFEIVAANDNMYAFNGAFQIKRSEYFISSISFPHGNVGIGKNNPEYKLDVNGILNAKEIYQNGSPFIKTNQWDDVTSGIIYPSGSVGIGTANMNAKLHIAAPQDQIMIEDSNGAPHEKKWMLKADNGSFEIVAVNDHFNAFNGAFQIKRSGYGISSISFPHGNVGVGNNIPAYKLDVNGILNAKDIYKNGSPYIGSSQWDNAASGINYANGNVGIGTTSPAYKLDVAGTINVHDIYKNGAPFLAGSSQWNDIVGGIAYSSGSVGIGTGNVQAKLHLSGPQDQLIIEDSNGNADEKKWILKADGGMFQILTANDSFSSFFEALQIKRNGPFVDSVNFTSGNVGIGTASPAKKLVVVGLNNEGFNLYGSGPGYAFFGYDQAGQYLRFGSYDSGFKNVVIPDGNFGIGTANPQSKLQVNGYIQLSLTAGIPPSADCSQQSEEGRMKFDPDADMLYVCSGTSGWISK